MTKTVYKINQSFRPMQRGRYRRRLLAAVVLLLVIGGAALAIYSDLRDADQNTGTPATGPTYHKAIAAAEVFKNSYFQFSDTAKWQFMPNDSTASKYTYINYIAKLPAHSVTVYVNQTPPVIELATTRVLPVSVVNGNSFTVGPISDTCGSLFKPGELKRVRPQAIAGTTMLCVPDSPQYTAEVGQIGADYNLNLKRADGTTARYVIIYRNLTANPEPGPFLRIMRTFQAL
jgi:hypothetical protein